MTKDEWSDVKKQVSCIASKVHRRAIHAIRLKMYYPHYTKL